MFKSSKNNLASASMATDWAHDDRLLSDPFDAPSLSVLLIVVVGGIGLSTFAEPRTDNVQVMK